jgi:phosphatidylglycerophosphate synthase
VNPKHWPNIISAARIALMPVVLGSALAHSRQFFLILLGISLATDVLDGFLARRLNAYSELGRKLDSFADYLTMITGLVGIALLWPEIFRRELPWVIAGVGAFFGVVIYGFARLGRAPCYHTWAAKFGAVVCVLSIIPLLADRTAVPFHCAIVVQILAGLDEMTIAFLVPSHVGEMQSSWHALQLCRQRETGVPSRVQPPVR